MQSNNSPSTPLPEGLQAFLYDFASLERAFLQHLQYLQEAPQSPKVPNTGKKAKLSEEEAEGYYAFQEFAPISAKKKSPKREQ